MSGVDLISITGIKFIINWYQSLVLYFQTQELATKIDLENSIGQNDFNIWKIKMEALLITQGLEDAIEPATKKKGKKVSL